MNLELIKKLNYFNMHANLGFQFDGIDNFEKYRIAYHNKIKDYWYNFITDIKTKSKEEFDKIILDASIKMKARNREIAIAILPYMKEIYNSREMFFDNNYELVSNEVWQIFDNFKELDNIATNCSLNVKLEKTTDMKLYSEEMIKAYQTGDEDDPYGDLDSVYKEVYENYKKKENEYIDEFYFAKVNNEIVGITSGVYDSEIYGIYGLAVKKEFRCKGIEKEIIKQQLQMCKDKKLKLAFLQTEDGYYPADTYRKLGFKDVCTEYYYIKREVKEMKENKLIIFINKSVKEVFEYSLESNNVPKWIISIKEEIPSERPVKVGTKLKNIGVNSSTWNYYEVIDFVQDKTFTLKRLNGDYFVKYTCTQKDTGTEFEYFEWVANGDLDGLMEMSALELLKKLIENQ